MELPQKLREYINANRAGGVPIQDPDEPLGIDSLGLIRLVGYMENELGIVVADEELLAENFESLRTLEALLGQKSIVGQLPEAAGEMG